MISWPTAVVLCVLILCCMEVAKVYIERDKPPAKYCSGCSKKLYDEDEYED